MRSILALMIAVGGSTACAGNSTDAHDETPISNGCPSSVVGTWKGATQDDELVLSSDGSFRYSGFDGCDNTGTFACSEPNLSPGTMEVSVSSSTNGYCLSVGTHSCETTLNGDSLAYDCSGEGSLHYRR